MSVSCFEVLPAWLHLHIPTFSPPLNRDFLGHDPMVRILPDIDDEWMGRVGPQLQNIINLLKAQN